MLYLNAKTAQQTLRKLFHISPSHSPPHQQRLPLNNPLTKPNQKNRLPGPHLPPFAIVRRHTCAQPTSLAHAFNHARYKRRTVQLAHLFWHTDVLVNEWLVVADHVFVVVGRGVLDGIGGAAEEVSPEGGVDKLEEGEDAGRARGRGGGAVEDEGEDTEAEGDADCGESEKSGLVGVFEVFEVFEM